eukprot:TRINITY_DN396_c0_g1_i2.p1 TRINITY_DN396_c0_g1~~TRINITY_DN396_c0_g1_i2.p1  ORF type:complete len:856 (+),score=296.69 TRINITY_DN396_c0_g1_i2:141-2708(+)
MGSLWRSEEMQLVQLFVQIEAAHDTVDELGHLGLISFRDLNPDVNAFQRNFVSEVRRCDEMCRKVRYFADQVSKANLDNELGSFGGIGSGDSEGRMRMDEMETRFDDLEKELIQMNSHQEMLDRNYNELVELQFVLEHDEVFFGAGASLASQALPQERRGLLDDQGEGGAGIYGGAVNGGGANLGFVTGVILRDKVAAFERVLWRATRGNMYLKQDEIEEKIKDPNTGDMVQKNVFIVFFQGERLSNKIRRLCEAFGANMYPCPETPHERQELRSQVNSRLDDLRVVLSRTRDHSKSVLVKVALDLDQWKEQVLSEKGIYHTMNMFNYDVGRKCLIAEGWCPTYATEDVQLALRRATERSGAIVPSILSVVRSPETPPTYFKTNKFTEAFQGIIESYGVASYGEVNPTPFSIVTFPFLFGVMFGDLGHGFLMLLFALSLVIFEKKMLKMELNEIVEMMFGARYLLVGMSFFAMWMGLLYNEVFSVPAAFFASKWYMGEPDSLCVQQGILCYDSTGIGYPLGVDWNWYGVSNQLNFYNSLKMKMAVILGVSQMTLGVIISLFNHIHFKKYSDIFTEFIPRFLFLTCSFGYMCFLIVLKWNIDYREMAINTNDDPCVPANDPMCVDVSTCGLLTDAKTIRYDAPSLLNLMIMFFIQPYSVTECQFLPLFPYQWYVQCVLIVLMAVSCPWMLFAKPLLALYQSKQKAKHERGYQIVGDEEEAEEEEFDFGEIMVHQMIHSIEYILGAVSNTASYLRLWALSLAHSELSAVFYEQIILQIYQVNVGMLPLAGLVFIGWAVWAALTVGVLLGMESLSAFLHAMRLHWVEFMNKFYLSDGYLFEPFSFKRIMAQEKEDSTM